jgi:hypothetical protein
MALTTVAFRAPSRLVALDLAHRLRARGWTVEVGRPAHAYEGRLVRVTAPDTALEQLHIVASETSPDVVQEPQV